MDATTDILSYPQHHGAWLDAMGVSRWAFKGEAIETAGAVLAEQAPIVIAPVAEAWSTSIQTARYWVIGNAALNDAELALLAGMMAAIGAEADDVVYSFCGDALESSVQNTRVANWSRLNVQPVAVFDNPPAVRVLMLGDDVAKTARGFDEGKTYRIPALSDILAQPLLKRDAWQVLKKMWAESTASE